MAKKGLVGLSLQDLNQYTAHQAHQADRDARKRSLAASNCYPEGSPAEEASESPAEEVEELGEGDGY